jgi:hypothetical protein
MFSAGTNAVERIIGLIHYEYHYKIELAIAAATTSRLAAV